MKCPHCKNDINIRKLWLNKSLRDKCKDLIIYFSNAKFLVAAPEEEPDFDFSNALVSFLAIFPGLFFVIGFGSLFITYTDYKGSGKISDLIELPLFFFSLGLLIPLAILIILYFDFRSGAEFLFNKGFFSVECPHCKKEIRKIKTMTFKK